jgi:lipid-binding SYLF domain-containing protein
MRKHHGWIVQAAVLGLLMSAGLTTPSLAETGTMRVIFTKAGFVVGVGGGHGVLTLRGKHYPLRVSGASIGATIGASTTKLVGKALNMNGYRDIEGTYSALGVGGALAAGVGGVQLQNADGVILQLTGAKVGVELSASLAGVTIMMD